MQAMRYGLLGAALGALLAPTYAMADPATEVSTLGDYSITLHLHDFLTPEDLSLLRIVAKDKAALALFVPDGGGFSALAVSPADGFTKDGLPVASASALGGLPDADAARAAAASDCQAASKSDAPCVIILEVAPKA